MVRLGDGPDRTRSWIHEAAGTIGFGGNPGSPESHPTVGEGRTVLNRQDPLALD